MSKWQVEFQTGAEKDLARLAISVRRRVIARLEWLAENFDDIIPVALGSVWRGFFKLRVGDWRIIYRVKIAEQIIVVCYIDRRDKVYII